MKYGLLEDIIEKIENIAKNYSKYKFYVFGSRARGDYKKTSDIDIAIFEEVSEKEKFEIMNEFDCLNLIYNIDLIFVSKDTKEELLESIIKDRKEI